jgi:hypothetical protein
VLVTGEFENNGLISFIKDVDQYLLQKNCIVTFKCFEYIMVITQSSKMILDSITMPTT